MILLIELREVHQPEGIGRYLDLTDAVSCAETTCRYEGLAIAAFAQIEKEIKVTCDASR